MAAQLCSYFVSPNTTCAFIRSSQGCSRPIRLQADPHILQHACGYALAGTRAIQGWLGHHLLPL
jgi:hypothetical protein